MAQYIDRSAVVAELERLYNLEYDNTSNLSCGKKIMLRNILLFLDTLEVKEVDLEKETKKWWKERLHLNPENQLWMDAYQSVEFAKHFFELGLKAQKGE